MSWPLPQFYIDFKQLRNFRLILILSCHSFLFGHWLARTEAIVSLIRSVCKRIWNKLISISRWKLMSDLNQELLIRHKQLTAWGKVIFEKSFLEPQWNLFLVRKGLCKEYRNWGDSDVDQQGLNSILEPIIWFTFISNLYHLVGKISLKLKLFSKD